jgi:hypothetical protein
MGFDSRAMQWNVKSTAGAGEKRLDPTVIQKNLGTGMYVEHVKFIRSLNELTRANKTIMTLLFVKYRHIRLKFPIDNYLYNYFYFIYMITALFL